MQQQSGATQLRLNVQAATFLPGCHKVEDVRVRTQPLMVPGFPHTAIPLTVAPEAISGALHRILTAVLVALHLQKMQVSTVSRFFTVVVKGTKTKPRFVLCLFVFFKVKLK